MHVSVSETGTQEACGQQCDLFNRVHCHWGYTIQHPAATLIIGLASLHLLGVSRTPAPVSTLLQCSSAFSKPPSPGSPRRSSPSPFSCCTHRLSSGDRLSVKKEQFWFSISASLWGGEKRGVIQTWVQSKLGSKDWPLKARC